MKVKCYISSADIRLVDKTTSLRLVKEYEFVMLKDQTSTEELTIILQCLNNEEMQMLNNVNYFYVEELDTYYYRTDIQFMAGHRVKFSTRHDLLMTYHEQIINLTCVIERQENNYNQYLPDNKYKVLSYPRVQTFNFPNGFNRNDSNYYLVIAGGGE